jgi:septation ring formation regulator EzrA
LNVPQLLDQLESLEGTVESQKGQLESKNGQLESLEGTVESQKGQIEALSFNSVRALRGANFTAEEISERLKLDLSEVNRILKANDGGA